MCALNQLPGKQEFVMLYNRKKSLLSEVRWVFLILLFYSPVTFGEVTAIGRGGTYVVDPDAGEVKLLLYRFCCTDKRDKRENPLRYQGQLDTLSITTRGRPRTETGGLVRTILMEYDSQVNGDYSELYYYDVREKGLKSMKCVPSKNGEREPDAINCSDNMVVAYDNKQVRKSSANRPPILRELCGRDISERAYEPTSRPGSAGDEKHIFVTGVKGDITILMGKIFRPGAIPYAISCKGVPTNVVASDSSSKSKSLKRSPPKQQSSKSTGNSARKLSLKGGRESVFLEEPNPIMNSSADESVR